MRTTVVAAGAIIVAAVAAVPYVSGRMVEHDIRDALDGYNKRQSLVTASIVDYERNWLRSEFVTKLSVRDGGEVARATTRLRHAPFNGLQFASGESEVHFAQSYAATEHYYFDGQTPLAISFDVDFSRRRQRDAALVRRRQARHRDEGHADRGGASSGRFSIARDKTFRFDWSMPKAGFDDTKLSIAIEGLAVSAHGQLGDDDLSERSGFKLSLASYRAQQGPRRITARDFSVSTQMTPAADTLRFGLAVRIGRRRDCRRRYALRLGIVRSRVQPFGRAEGAGHQVFGRASQRVGRRRVGFSKGAARDPRAVRPCRRPCGGRARVRGRQARSAHASRQRRGVDAREHRQGAHDCGRRCLERRRRRHHVGARLDVARPCGTPRRRSVGRRAGRAGRDRAARPRAASFATTATPSSSTSPHATASTW